jgi:DnaK suppressor protein
MEARNRHAWQDGTNQLESGNAEGMRLPTERVVPLGRRRGGAAHRKAAEARAAQQNQPVDAVVGLVRPAPVREEVSPTHAAGGTALEQAVVVPPGLAERLRERQTELQARLARLEGEAQEFDEDSRPKYSNHPADEAVALLDRAGRDAVARVLMDDIVQVDRALERLAAGSYGLCDDCGQMIPPKRLEARPTATLCVSCQSKREMRANRGRVIAH